MKFESKIAAFLDTHLLFAWDAETKQLIGCKWVMGTVDSRPNSKNGPIPKMAQLEKKPNL